MSLKFYLVPKLLIRLIECPSRGISTSTRLLLDQKWREKRGLPRNPNAYGPLINNPDYSYMDGRPAPIGSRLRNRMLKQMEHARKIIELSKEVDFAVEHHNKKCEEIEEKKNRILERKLKPKGMPYITQNKS